MSSEGEEDGELLSATRPSSTPESGNSETSDEEWYQQMATRASNQGLRRFHNHRESPH